MVTLESAARRLEEALRKLEVEIEKTAQAEPFVESDRSNGEDRDDLQSLRSRYNDLSGSFEAMRERYEALKERNRQLAASLDKTISRLRQLSNGSSEN